MHCPKLKHTLCAYASSGRLWEFRTYVRDFCNNLAVWLTALQDPCCIFVLLTYQYRCEKLSLSMEMHYALCYRGAVFSLACWLLNIFWKKKDNVPEVWKADDCCCSFQLKYSIHTWCCAIQTMSSQYNLREWPSPQNPSCLRSSWGIGWCPRLYRFCNLLP